MFDLNLHFDENNPQNNVISNPLHLFFQEVELAIQIAPGEIWGVKDGINLKRYIFNQYVTLTQIKNEITTYIRKNCAHAYMFPYKISVETVKNPEGSDLIYIVMSVPNEDNDGQTHSKDFIQKFLIGSSSLK
jgi:hypothetical protein